MTRYRCPECGVEAEIEEKKVDIELEGSAGNLPSFPSHPNCELAKADPDTSELEVVR